MHFLRFSCPYSSYERACAQGHSGLPLFTELPRRGLLGNPPALDVLDHTFGQTKSYECWMSYLPSSGKLCGRCRATERTAMSSKEKQLWKQAIRILKQNSVTVRAPAAEQAPAEAPKRAA